MSGNPAPEGYTFYYFYGTLDELENQMEDRMEQLGVPEEEYQNAAEYLSKDELIILSAKVTLAANLDDSYILSRSEEIDALQDILELPGSNPYGKFERPFATPTEYKELSSLLKDYYHSLNTIEDYDVQAE